MKIAIVIPTYKARSTINEVILDFYSLADWIIVIEDNCPMDSSDVVMQMNFDPNKVKVHKNKFNLGVGGSTIEGYRYAKLLGAEIIVKVDSDRQMHPSYFQSLIQPIQAGTYHYSKGNRFNSYRSLEKMPPLRVFGNSILTILTKFSSGYWFISDPCNGYTAISSKILNEIPLNKVSRRFFFESDLLHHLNIANANVMDVPMIARYGEEKSNLSEFGVILPFLFGHAKNFLRRLKYQYFLEGINFGSIYLFFGTIFFVLGLIQLAQTFYISALLHKESVTGTVILWTVVLLFGAILLNNFIKYDIHKSKN